MLVFSSYPLKIGTFSVVSYKGKEELFMVIWLSLDDGAGTIDLFGEDEAYHLMGESHARKRYFLVAATVNIG